MTHRRVRPRRHALRYSIFFLLLDLDEVPALARRLWLFSHRRFNLVGFDPRDHGDGGGELRAWVEAQLAAAGIAAGGAIRILCQPRVLGFAFNPLSVFFCHRPDGGLAAVLYQVNNTFGQRHCYLIPVAAAQAMGADIRQDCAKDFYVSPFMEMDLQYRFRLHRPDSRVAVAIRAEDAGGLVLAAAFAGRRRALGDAGLALAVLRHPLQALMVLGGIHWEALKLWRKGLRLQPRPAPPAHPVSVVAPARRGEAA